MLDGHLLTWLCDPYVVHLASWQSGTQTHPGAQKKKKSKNKKGGKGVKQQQLAKNCFLTVCCLHISV